MKPSLQTRLGQQLTLTPQLRQAIKLLQLSATELEVEITEAIDSNPLLEREEDAIDDTPADGEAPAPEAPAAEREGEDSNDTFEDVPTFEWEDDGFPRTGNGSSDGEDREDTVAASQNLHEHLAWQLHLSPLRERDLMIGEALIEAIGDDGYLGATLEDIQSTLAPALVADAAEIETVLHLIQRFDPVGVGARTLSECLCVQLGLLDADTPGHALARQICGQHLDALAKHGALKLAAMLHQPPEDVDVAVALLKSLDPKPGAQISPGDAEFITPDAIAYRQGGVWKVATSAGSQPRLAINRHYEGLIGKSSRDNDSYLRAQLQEARWLIKSLETRADTLLRVARSIVRQQSGFLEHGPQAMRPLTLREVAEELDLHESTISRATTRKYLRTPRGTFEFKYFFSSGIATDSGGGASATAIQAMLRKLIEAENPRSPLSDARLAEMLKGDGIPVARRTVAKYREAMNIASSNERQRL